MNRPSLALHDPILAERGLRNAIRHYAIRHHVSPRGYAGDVLERCLAQARIKDVGLLRRVEAAYYALAE